MRSLLRHYVIALALVAAATFARLSLDLLTNQTLTFATFYPAVLLAAMWGGLWPGILAAVLSTLVGWYVFMPPRSSFKVPTADTQISVLLFFGCSLLLVWIAERYRQTLQKLNDEKARRDLPIGEMHHRGKNTLAVSQAIVNQTLKGEPELARKINGRLAALTSANDVLVGSDDQTARLSDLIRTEITPYGVERIRIKGPALRLSGGDARSMALLVHELATNAAKYGALSASGGTINVSWTFDNGILKLIWQEAGGPRIHEPDKAGFGSQLIRSVTTSMNGSVQMDYASTGLICTIELQPGADTALTSTHTVAAAL